MGEVFEKTVNVKEGWKTSEFWMALAAQIVAVLVLLGIIKPEDQDIWTQTLTHFFFAVTFVVSFVSYLYLRYALKKTDIELGKSVPQLPMTADTSVLNNHSLDQGNEVIGYYPE